MLVSRRYIVAYDFLILPTFAWLFASCRYGKFAYRGSCKQKKFWLAVLLNVNQSKKVGGRRSVEELYQALFFVSPFPPECFTERNENRAWSQVTMKKVRDAGFSWKRSGNAGSGPPSRPCCQFGRSALHLRLKYHLIWTNRVASVPSAVRSRWKTFAWEQRQISTFSHYTILFFERWKSNVHFHVLLIFLSFLFLVWLS